MSWSILVWPSRWMTICPGSKSATRNVFSHRRSDHDVLESLHKHSRFSNCLWISSHRAHCGESIAGCEFLANRNLLVRQGNAWRNSFEKGRTRKHPNRKISCQIWENRTHDRTFFWPIGSWIGEPSLGTIGSGVCSSDINELDCPRRLQQRTRHELISINCKFVDHRTDVDRNSTSKIIVTEVSRQQILKVPGIKLSSKKVLSQIKILEWTKARPPREISQAVGGHEQRPQIDEIPETVREWSN